MDTSRIVLNDLNHLSSYCKRSFRSLWSVTKGAEAALYLAMGFLWRRVSLRLARWHGWISDGERATILPHLQPPDQYLLQPTTSAAQPWLSTDNHRAKRLLTSGETRLKSSAASLR